MAGIALYGYFTLNSNTACSNTAADLSCSEDGSFTGSGNSATTTNGDCSSIGISFC